MSTTLPAEGVTLKAGHWSFLPALTSEGERLDQFLAQNCPFFSRTTIRRIIDLGGVHVDGRRVRSCSRAVKAQEEILLYCDGRDLTPWKIADDSVLLRDRDLIALDKPAGIETQPTPARFQGTLYAALQKYLQDPQRLHLPPELGMVQRLDRDTSGVIVFSTSARAHKRMTEIVTSRAIHKTYLALVAGQPETEVGEIRSNLARCRDNRVRSVDRGGQEAVTAYRVLARFPEAALVEVEPLTGRMHQIRVHLAESGHPLLGDERYGGPSMLRGRAVARHMLHARRLEFPHPVTAVPMRIEAPLPDDMQSLLDHLTTQEVE